MSKYYYEIDDDKISDMGGKYFVSESIPPSTKYGLYQHHSTRIWIEGKNAGIRYYKNEYTDLYDTCGLLSEDEIIEFTCIKLRCNTIV